MQAGQRCTSHAVHISLFTLAACRCRPLQCLLGRPQTEAERALLRGVSRARAASSHQVLKQSKQLQMRCKNGQRA